MVSTVNAKAVRIAMKLKYRRLKSGGVDGKCQGGAYSCEIEVSPAKTLVLVWEVARRRDFLANRNSLFSLFSRVIGRPCQRARLDVMESHRHPNLPPPCELFGRDIAFNW